MKIFNLLAILISFNLIGQNYIIKGEVFDFEVGDVIQTHEFYSIRNTYITDTYLNKSFSSNNDTVTYLIERKTYTPQFTENGETYFGMDTVVEFFTGLSDTIYMNNLTTLTHADSVYHLKDTIYTFLFSNSCPIEIFERYSNSLLSCFECTHSSTKLIKGLGYFAYESGYLNSNWPISIGTRLHYFKKNGVECGTYTTGINEIDSFTNFEIYPNPSSEIIEIKSDFYFDAYDITSIEGLTIRKNAFLDKNIKINELNSGIYFINLKLNGQTIARKRFCKI
jgi:hypothetical protein